MWLLDAKDKIAERLRYKIRSRTGWYCRERERGRVYTEQYVNRLGAWGSGLQLLAFIYALVGRSECGFALITLQIRWHLEPASYLRC